MNMEAQARLSEIRSQLGLAPSAVDGQQLLAEAAALKPEPATEPAAQPATEPAPAAEPAASPQPQDG
jgi:hypothetical protein